MRVELKEAHILAAEPMWRVCEQWIYKVFTCCL